MKYLGDPTLVEEELFNQIYNIVSSMSVPASFVTTIDGQYITQGVFYKSFFANHHKLSTFQGVVGCPMGQLISDEDYSFEMEGFSIKTVIERWFPQNENLKELAQKCQNAHMNASSSPYTFHSDHITALDQISHEFNLELPSKQVNG